MDETEMEKLVKKYGYSELYKAAYNKGIEDALAIRPQDIEGGIRADASSFEVWTKHWEAIKSLEKK